MLEPSIPIPIPDHDDAGHDDTTCEWRLVAAVLSRSLCELLVRSKDALDWLLGGGGGDDEGKSNRRFQVGNIVANTVATCSQREA